MSTSPWAIVRAEPSEKMLDAAAHASMKHLLDCIHDPKLAHKVGSEEMVRLTHASRYRTMLSASDAPTQVLTDAEMRECANGCFRPNGELENYKFARAIEAAILAKLAAAPAQQPNGKGGE